MSHLPEVFMIDIGAIFSAQAPLPLPSVSAASDVSHESSALLMCLVLSSDGVWDNWVYPDVTKFVMDQSCMKAVYGAADGANRVAKSFMTRNMLFSKRNFGSQADNATGIVLYISNSSSFMEASS